jgi:hypothetical protein
MAVVIKVWNVLMLFFPNLGGGLKMLDAGGQIENRAVGSPRR